ncbi:MAG: winged helix-turn-helix domain-containing protein [Galbitalea sp.]
MITIDSSSPTPPVEQLRLQIGGMIRAGDLAAGGRMPTVRQLAQDLGLSQGTVARAYSSLEADGLIETRRALGTRVAAGRVTATATTKAARALVAVARAEGLDLEGILSAVRAAAAAENPTASP